MNVPKLRFKDNNDNDYPQWNHSFFYDTFKFLSTNSYSRNDMNTINGTIKNIHYGDILTKFNHIIDTEKDILPYLNDNIIVKNLLNYTIQSGDIVIADTAEDYTTGKTCEIINSNNQLIVAGLHTMLCRPKQNIFTVGFLGYFMNSNIYHNQLLPLITGIKVYSIIKKEIIKTQISIPCIEEQKKIANFLTTVDKKITNLENIITSLENQKKGLLQQIFSQKLRFKDKNGNNYPNWEKKKLGDILKDFYLGGNYKNSTKITKYPLLKMGNLDRGKINLNKIEYIEENEPINERDKIHFGDLFFNTRNTPDLVGKVAIWRNELPLMYFNSNLMKMTFDNNFFMNYKFNTKKVILKLRSIATGTTSVGAIYTKDLLKLELNIPCLEEQTKIADFLSAFDRKLENQKAQLEHWQQIKKGLLQQMFV